VNALRALLPFIINKQTNSLRRRRHQSRSTLHIHFVFCCFALLLDCDHKRKEMIEFVGFICCDAERLTVFVSSSLSTLIFYADRMHVETKFITFQAEKGKVI